MSESKIRISCIGDSNTDGWPGELDYTPYTHYLGESLGLGYEVKNFGKFNTTATSSMDDPYINNEVYKKAIASKPNIVTIMIGGNECKEYNWEAHGSDFKKDYGALADIFLNLDSNPKVILCTPVPIFPDNFYKLSSKIMEDEVAPTIREVAKEKNLLLIDVFRKFRNINDPSLFDKDKLHINNKGHKIVADIFYDVIAAL